MRGWIWVLGGVTACAQDGIHIAWQVLAGADRVACDQLAMPSRVQVTTSELLGSADATFACTDGDATFEPSTLGEETDFDVTVDLVADDGTLLDRGFHGFVHHAPDTRTEVPDIAFQVAGPAQFSWRVVQAQTGEVACTAVGGVTVRVAVEAVGMRDFPCNDLGGTLPAIVYGHYQIDASLLRPDGSVLAAASQPDVLARGAGGLSVGFQFDVP